MPFWQSRNNERDHDRTAQIDQRRDPIRKAASMASLAGPRPASSPMAPVDRSPYPPRISSLGRVPLLGWDAERVTPTRQVRPKAFRPASAHTTRTPRVEMAPGTLHALGIRAGLETRQGTSNASLPPCQTHTDTTFAAHERACSLCISSSNSSSHSPATVTTRHAPMPERGVDLRNGHHPASSPLQTDSSTFASSSPTMRKASPMPQALPQPTFAAPSAAPFAPWQYATNGLTSPTDSTPAAGKTSQVLAKLTSECDRLRREMKAEKAAKEEAVQQFQALKGRVNWLEDKNSTLTMQLDANENALARKERRMDDLKASLEEEVARRKRAEEREAEMGRNLGETVSQAAKDVSEAHMAQKNAENSYATLENEYNGLQRRIMFLRKEVEELTNKINKNSAIHKQQLTQLEVLLDQQRQQQEKSDRQVQEMGALLKSYRDTEENTKSLETQMQDAVHEMRWVMQLHQVRAGQDPTPKPAPRPSQHSQPSSTSISTSPKRSSASPKLLRKVPVLPGAAV